MRLIAILLLASCTTTEPDPAPPDAPSANEIVLTGAPIVATAQLGTGDALLGTSVNLQFAQVNGTPLFAPRGEAGALTRTPVNQVSFGWVQALDTQQLGANLAGWNLGSAALEASNTTRYMSMRAYQIDYYVDVDLAQPSGTAPTSAVYFVSKIYYGHSYESLFSASDTKLTAAVAAELPNASGSIMAAASTYSLMATNVGRGLVPKSGAAVFAKSDADVLANYSADGPAVPIFVEYRLVPGGAEPSGSPIPWRSPFRASIAIDEVDVFHNGAVLDASNTAWDLQASCTINGAVVAPASTVFSSTSVSAGGSTVDPSGSGPQDPNQANPTSTYGRYANLPWLKVFPIATGNVLRCQLAGNRTDTSPPTPLPPVTIMIPVDVAHGVDGRAGNYDTATGLDYQVHYSVTYQAN